MSAMGRLYLAMQEKAESLLLTHLVEDARKLFVAEYGESNVSIFNDCLYAIEEASLPSEEEIEARERYWNL